MTEQDMFRGMNLEALPEGWAPVGVVAMFKCLNEEGEATWAFRTSEDLNDEEVLGALVVRVELSKTSLVDAYTPIDD